MNRTTLIIALIVVAFVSSGYAQSADQSPPAKRKFKYDGKIETLYDKENDRTLVFFKLMAIKALEEPREHYDLGPWSQERLRLSIYFSYQGHEFATPNWVTISFISATENPQKYEDHLLTTKTDSERLTLGTMKILSTVKVTRKGKMQLVRQTMELPIKYQDFLRLANAKKLKLKLGSTDIELEKENLEAIRDLAAHTVP